MKTRRLVGILCGLVAFTPAAHAARPSMSEGVTRIPVTFAVANTDTSKAPPCASDASTYTVRGHLTGPKSLLQSGTAKAVTVYLFGYDVAEWSWALDAVAGYDFTAALARAGHVSFTFDEVGYGASGRPADGNLTCFGAQADMAHQVVEILRSGRYTLDGEPGIAFSHIVLAGHDVGGLVAEIEAYSYGGIDALVQADWADQGQTSFIVQRAATAAADWCTTNPAETAPGQPTGYVHFATEDDWHNGQLFYDADPRVVQATDTLRKADPDPCGLIRSAVPTVMYHNPNSLQSALGTASSSPPTSPLAQVTVPVLEVYGNNDTVVWTHEGELEQQNDFTGSADKTTVFILDAGHFPMFERTAPKFDQAIAGWLAVHGA